MAWAEVEAASTSAYATAAISFLASSLSGSLFKSIRPERHATVRSKLDRNGDFTGQLQNGKHKGSEKTQILSSLQHRWVCEVGIAPPPILAECCRRSASEHQDRACTICEDEINFCCAQSKRVNHSMSERVVTKDFNRSQQPYH
jgi:hypothetical protein